MNAPRPRILQLAALDYSFRVHLLPLVKTLAAEFDVICCGSSGTFREELERAGIAYREIDLRRNFNVAAHAVALLRLYRLMRDERVDILHSHTAIGGLLGRIAARAAGVPVIVHTAHGFHVHEKMRRAAAWFFVFLERLCARYTHLLLVQNEQDRALAATWRRASDTEVINLGNGIDLSRFDPDAIPADAVRRFRAEAGVPDGAPIVSFIARPTREKGGTDFREIVRRLAARRSDVWFVCVAPDLPNERRSVREALAADADRDRLRILGFRNDVPTILAATGVFLLPSYIEGLSKVLIEAMAMGRPIVTSHARGCRDLIVDRSTGRLVPIGDIDGFVDAVDELLDDPDAREALGRRARQHALRSFDERAVLERQLNLFRGLVAGWQTP